MGMARNAAGGFANDIVVRAGDGGSAARRPNATASASAGELLLPRMLRGAVKERLSEARRCVGGGMSGAEPSSLSADSAATALRRKSTSSTEGAELRPMAVLRDATS